MRTKTYVITGATSGIGRELIQKISAENVVFAGYRDETKLEELKFVSSNIYPFYVDYANPSTIKSAVENILAQTTKIDTLINIAGCVVAGPLEKIEMSEIKRQFDVNVFGHLEFSKGLMEILDGGKIINVSSMASFGIFPFVAPYCASKRCLDMLFNSILLETKKSIQVVSIKPGVISTPLWAKSIESNSKYIDKCEGYEKEMAFLMKNAKKNEEKGLSAQKVVDVILKVDSLNRPKLSYTVGKDAFWASQISKLPQEFLNHLVRLGIKLRVNKN